MLGEAPATARAIAVQLPAPDGYGAAKPVILPARPYPEDMSFALHCSPCLICDFGLPASTLDRWRSEPSRCWTKPKTPQPDATYHHRTLSWFRYFQRQHGGHGTLESGIEIGRLALGSGDLPHGALANLKRGRPTDNRPLWVERRHAFLAVENHTGGIFRPVISAILESDWPQRTYARVRL